MHKLRHSGVDTYCILALFYRSFVVRIFTFGFVAWYFSLSVVNNNEQNNIAVKQQYSMTKLCETGAVRVSHAILWDASLLYGGYELLPTG